jgi:early endosome antigen 1
LEAKLENSNDERRMLVERCIASEGECEKLREKVTEHRRKLDDAQAALQELGRENQSLQVQSNLS